jgi:hypothetical protein
MRTRFGGAELRPHLGGGRIADLLDRFEHAAEDREELGVARPARVWPRPRGLAELGVRSAAPAFGPSLGPLEAVGP